MAPLVSVVMPVYNAGSYLRESLNSVVEQSCQDWELIVIDDGSTDRTCEIVTSYADSRIRLQRNDVNMGLAHTRNMGISMARGEYVAWLDADDVSNHDRLADQVHYLERHREIDLCGTWVRTLGSGSSVSWRFPRHPDYIRARLIFDNPLATSSVMMRMEAFRGSDLRFDARFAPAEDYDLWERLSAMSSFANLPKFHTRYRLHPDQVSVRQSSRQRNAVRNIQSRLIDRLGIVPTSTELDVHLKIGVDWCRTLPPDCVPLAHEWLNRLQKANAAVGAFSEPAFTRVIQHRRLLTRNALHPSRWRSLQSRAFTAIH